jgi:tRNA dimethylallyltransferase
MLYFRALLHGLDDLPRADAALRQKLEIEAARRGWPALHADLARVDPLTAARLAANDSQRIGRALEIYQLTGTPMSALLDQVQTALPYRVLQLALIPPDRAVLHQRIATRFDAMLADGLIDEVKTLRQMPGLTADLPAMRAVGYRQAWAYLNGEIDLNGLREQGLAATRQLAKRQLTWLRSWPDAVTLDCLAADLKAQACAQVEHHLTAG